MPLLSVQCRTCTRIFSSGIEIGEGSTVTLSNNLINCPFCGSTQNLPDGTFRGTVEGIVRVLQKAENPLEQAKRILEALERSRTAGNLSDLSKQPWYNRWQKWLPNSPEKIAAYIAIFYTIIQLLTKEPDKPVVYNQTFINQYNQTINIKDNQDPVQSQQRVSPTNKVGRNDPCPCGSGKKYKKCHGR